MTKKEALEQGYTRAAKEDEVIFIKDWDGFTEGYMVLEKELKPYKINESTIECLITEYLYEQDEIGDEEGVLAEEARGVDYSDIVNQLNEAFSKYGWCGTTDIELIPYKLYILEDFLHNFKDLLVEVRYFHRCNIVFRSELGRYQYYVTHSIDIGEDKVIYPGHKYSLEDLSIISAEIYRDGELYESFKK